MNYLISVEGDEFTGKTTVAVPAIVRFFKSRDYIVQTSREPGGSERGEAMRREIFEKLREGLEPTEQAVLFNKARKLHIDEIIAPFLREGDKKAMVLDRYLDSTRIYQGFEGGVDFEKLFQLEKEYVGNLLPHITIILYFPDDKTESSIMNRKPAALKAREKINEIVPFDNVSLTKHLRRQQYHLQLESLALKNNEKRVLAAIDASGTPEEVSKLIIEKLSALQL